MSEFFELTQEPVAHEFSPEASAETVETKPHIRMEFFRHDEKTKESTAGPRPADSEVLLTEAGRIHAEQAGLARNPNFEFGIAFGSGRVRSQETAARSLYAGTGMIDASTDLADLREKSAHFSELAGIPGGSKMGVMDQLNFSYGPEDGPYNKDIYDRYLGSKDLLRFIYEGSDQRARELALSEGDTYTRTVGNIASVVKRYFIAERSWEKLAEQPKYAGANGELQRHLGSHQGTLEPFLMKLIENREGPAGVDRFLTGIKERNGTENGFGFSEGFSADVHPNDDGSYSATVKYRDQVWEVPESEIDAMVEAKNAFDSEIANSEQTKESIE